MVDYLNHPLDGCFERVRRANEHLADLRERIRETFAQQANSIVVKFDGNPPGHIIGATYPLQTYWPMKTAILIGEACYNLRSALDYLVFELAKRDSGSEQSSTQFPIESTPEGFAGRRKTYLKGINDGHVAAIERLQPYAGCDWSASLRDASNPDKHRHFVKTKGDFSAHIYSEIADDLGGIIGAHEFDAPHPIRGKVKVKVHITGHVTFDDGAPIIETLEKISREIADTLVAFKPEF